MALAVDASSPAAITSSAANQPTIVTAAFSPPQGVLVASISIDGAATNAPTIAMSNTGPSVSWESAIGTVKTNASTFLIVGVMAASGSGMTVTATMTGVDAGTDWGMKVWVVTGADMAYPVGGTATGASTTNNLTTTGFTIQRDGSLGFVSGVEYNDLGTIVSSDTTFSAEHIVTALDGGGGYKTLGAGGTSATFNLDAGGTAAADWQWSALELQAAPAVLFNAVGPSASGQGTAAVTSITWSHTCSGVNRYVVVGASMGGVVTGGTPLTATYAGTSMTQLGTSLSGTASTSGQVYLFGLIDPPTGAQTVVVTAPAARDLSGGSISFTGVDQAAPHGTAVTNLSDIASVSVAVPGTHVGNMVVDTASYGAGLAMTSTQTLRYNKILNGGTSAGSNSGSTAAGTGGTVTMGYSGAASDGWGIVAVELLMAVVSQPPTITAAPITYVATATPTPAGTTTSAGTASVTTTLPTGTAVGDRVFIFQSASNTTTTPASWTVLAKDVQVGPTGTAPGASTGRRYLSVYYRDYDGVWTMPAVTVTSATQNSNAVSAITLRKPSAGTWVAPTVSSAGNTSAASTAYSVTVPAFATTALGLLMSLTGTNDNVTASAQTLAQTGATFANLTERADTGTATGNDVAIEVSTADVTTGAAVTMTRAGTLSAASEGGTIVVQQTATLPIYPPFPRHIIPQAVARASLW